MIFGYVRAVIERVDTRAARGELPLQLRVNFGERVQSQLPARDAGLAFAIVTCELTCTATCRIVIGMAKGISTTARLEARLPADVHALPNALRKSRGAR